MSTSPAKSSAPQHSSILTPSTPRANKGIRRFQSAHALSSHFAPSNVTSSSTSPQRAHQHRNPSSSHRDPQPFNIPSVPSLPSHTRSRSNSDAPVSSISNNAPTPRRTAAARRVIAPGAKHVTLESLIREGPPSSDIAAGLNEMRSQVLREGVNSDNNGMSALRIYTWLILLCAPPIATDDYLALVHRGPSPAYAKIRNDTFRTLATDPLFRRRVSEGSLIRLLNAVAWRLHDAREERLGASRKLSSVEGSPKSRPAQPLPSSGKHTRGAATATTEGSEAGGVEPGTYVQGMNVLAAPFLYAARSETEAFVAFHLFLTRECPGYVRGAMDGVHKGLALVDKVLALVDPRLSSYLISKGMHAELYAFPSVLTLCACTPPLPEVLHLWDFLFAYGAHLNVLCIVAQLVMIRNTILSSPSPTKILRSFPPLQASEIKAWAISLIKKIPDELYDEIVIHAK
ncbi:MAG: hypothetical protein M1817_004923 [Caeruleum heppii]|nr:MAG: hypothetical protein M1817_004923 [Caeruleum heppii]